MYGGVYMVPSDLIVENVLVAFVDTSAIDPMYNDFSAMEHQFAALKKHIESKKLILLTHEIAVREMERHIREELPKQLDKLASVQKSKELVLLQPIRRYNTLFNRVETEKSIADTIKALKTKLKEIGVLILKTGNISVKSLMEDYFTSMPPFGAKKKKAEFPDAIMLQSLVRAIGDNHKIHIVASDGDWDGVCKSQPNFVIHKHLGSLLDYINKDNVASSAIKAFLSDDATIELVSTKLKEIVKGIDFQADGLTYDRKGLVEGYSYDAIELLDVSDMSYFIHTIEDIECSDSPEDNTITAIVTIVGSAHVKFNCSYFDEANSVWDSEDHEYIYKEYGSATEIHEVSQSCKVNYFSNNKCAVDGCIVRTCAVGYKRQKYRRYFVDWMRSISSSSISSSYCRISSLSWAIALFSSGSFSDHFLYSRCKSVCSVIHRFRRFSAYCCTLASNSASWMRWEGQKSLPWCI